MLVLLVLGIAGCCFGAPMAAPPPTATGPIPAATAEEQAAQITATREAETQRARVTAMDPAQRLARAEALLAAADLAHPERAAEARGHVEALPADFEPTRQRAVRRLLSQRERELGAAALADARAQLRDGQLGAARRALAGIPDHSPAAAQRAGVLRQIEQREEREARALARRGPLTDDEAQGLVLLYLRATAHDPDSIDLAECGRLWFDDTQWMIDCAYRGSNAFGATVLNATRFYIRQLEVVRTSRVSRIRM